MSLKNDIKELLENQVIDQQTADRISAYYLAQKKSINVATIISVAAAILVGAGVIFIIAYNWDDLPNFLRVVIGLIPWLATTYGCYYTLKNKEGQKNWSEAMSILHSCAFAGSFAIINQIYQVQLNEEQFTNIFLLASLPFVFIMRSATLSAIIISLVCMINCDYSNAFSKISMYIFLLADVAFLYNYYYKKSEKFLCELRVLALPIFWVIFFNIILKRDFSLWYGDHIEGTLFLIFSSVAYVIYEWINKSDRIKSNGTILKYIFYFTFFPAIIFFSKVGLNRIEGSELIAPAIASLPIIASVATKIIKREFPQWQTWIGLVFAILAIISGKLSIFNSFFALSIIAYTIFESCQDCDLLKLNVSILSLFAWTIVVLSDFDLPFYTLGFILILLGVALIIMNRHIIEKKKSHETK